MENIKVLAENLEKKGYEVSCFSTAKEAASYLNDKVDSTTVAFGGSSTIKDMGLYEELKEHNTAIWHWQGAAREDAKDTEIYISSVNGISMQGDIVNIDGNGNRVASTIFGHKKVYFIVGKNKIAENLDKAIWRARNIAAPKNAARLSQKTPCAVNCDKCYDCKSEDRICKVLTVFWEKPDGTPSIEIILVDEELGY